MHRIILIKLNLSLNLKQVLQPDQDSILGSHASLYKINDFKNSMSFLFLILLNNLSDFIEQLFKLKPTDLYFGLLVHVVQQLVGLFLDIIVLGVLLWLLHVLFIAIVGKGFVAVWSVLVVVWWFFLFFLAKQIHHIFKAVFNSVKNHVESHFHIVISLSELFPEKYLVIT